MKKNIFLLSFLFPFIGLATETEFQVRLCGTKEELNRLLPEVYNQKMIDTYYLESYDRILSQNGLSIRLRVGISKVEVTVKKRIAKEMSTDKETICEYDQHGSVKDYSCKINDYVGKEKFLKELKGNGDWKSMLSKQQLNLIQQSLSVLPEINLFGTLEVSRYQWNEELFGLVTFDFITQKEKSNITFHEISFRLQNGDENKGKRFLQYLSKKNVPLCENQIDWPVNKFDTLNVVI